MLWRPLVSGFGNSTEAKMQPRLHHEGILRYCTHRNRKPLSKIKRQRQDDAAYMQQICMRHIFEQKRLTLDVSNFAG